MSPGKFVPEPDGLVADFYTKVAATETLHFQRCLACKQLRHPPRYYCAACASPDWDLVPSAGLGTVFSVCRTERAFDKGWADDVPYTLVVVELDEGPRVVTAGRGFDGRPAIGDRAQVEVEARGEAYAFFWSSPA